MELSTKALRSQARLLLDAVARGETVTITYRGRPSARVVPLEGAERTAHGDRLTDSELFGLWADRDDLPGVDAQVRALRRGRRP
ncbi:MAG: type II toxin-antitoxin system prevent-host-death family antitoxin [Gammaproteobacteria bacterium]|jgi:prevent-host-death family protein|nr:type II toxin-antitoxin system prevent-host-death family antitoxin [Gammaproteobacteria bacterium]